MSIKKISERTDCFNINDLIMADMIRVDYLGQRETLWERPKIEYSRRGFPVNVDVVTVNVSNESELRYLQATVNRLKNCDVLTGKTPTTGRS